MAETSANRGLNWLNALPADEAQHELLKCCGSTRWAREVTRARPFSDLSDLHERATAVWSQLEVKDWLDAFRSHPKIGETKAREKTSSESSRWSRQEQESVDGATPLTLARLAELNRQYENKFGFIFIICATGKSPQEMLAALEHRMGNDPASELRAAADEQAKITLLRLSKLIGSA